MMSFSSIWTSVRRGYETRLEPERFKTLASVYWRTLLISTCIGVVAMIFFGVWELVAVLENLGAAQGGPTVTPTTLSRSDLQAVLSSYDARTSRYQTSKTASGGFVDPSK